VRRRMANLFSARTDRRGMVLGDKVEFETPRGDVVSGSCVKKGDPYRKEDTSHTKRRHAAVK
jgi:hypothetical protein